MAECLQSAAEAAQQVPPAPLAAVGEEEQHPRPASAFLWLKGIPMRGKPDTVVSLPEFPSRVSCFQVFLSVACQRVGSA